ncbi:MAG TPA: pyridoxal-dependent decarboxylase [Terriglobales bacterium]|nr:pyridoxal-dependent decarboxylase [Terriglobales bacterium]
MRFDLDSDTRRKVGQRLIELVDQYYSSLPNRPVQLPAEKRTYGTLNDPLPENGADPLVVLEEVFGEMVAKGFHVPSANYFGLMNPTPTYMGFIAEAMVSALNPQLATLARSQLASKIELETVRWIAERVGWNSEFGGTFTSGGNEANFSGMALALAHHFPSAMEDGIASIGKLPVMYASAESHHSLDKSAGLLGIGRKALQRVPVTGNLQLDPVKLEQMIQLDRTAGRVPFCVVATAGTTNSGIVDDLVVIAEVCRRNNLWMHVDGAYGASAVFSDKHRDLVRGIELADSITIDPHKWLAVPFAAGVILTRHPGTLQQAFSVASPYMPKAQGAHLPDNARISTQWTRRMNSLKLWLTLRVHGRKAYEEHIDRQLQLARMFADWVERSQYFELAAPTMLTIVNFRVKLSRDREHELAAAHASIVDAVTRDGQLWISDTVVNVSSVLRVMVTSYLTEERHVQALENVLEKAVKSLEMEPASTRQNPAMH